MNIRKMGFFALGPLLSSLLSSLSLPAIAWLFARADIGRLSMLQVACSFSTLLFSLGLDQAYVREYHETESKPRLLSLAIVPGLLLLVVFSVISINFSDELTLLIYDKKDSSLFFITLISVFAVFLSRFFSLVLRMQERALAFSMSQILPKLLMVLTILSFWLLGIPKVLLNLLLANLWVSFFTLVVLTWLIRKDLAVTFKMGFDWAKLKTLLRFGVPLIFGGLAFWGLTAMSQLSLRGMSNYSELGLYSVCLSFAGAASIFQSIFSTIWAPTVYKWAATGENFEQVNVVTGYVLSFVVFTFAICGMMAWLIPFVLPDEYDAIKYILVACLGQPLLYTLSETTVVGVWLSRKTAYALLAPLFAVITNFFLCKLLVSDYGARGAAISTFFAFIVFFIVRTESAVFVWHSFPRKKIYFFLILISFGAIFSTFGAEKFPVTSILVWFIIFLAAIKSFREHLSTAVIELKSLIKKRLNTN